MDRLPARRGDNAQTLSADLVRLDEIAQTLRDQLDICRFEYELDRNQTTISQYTAALRRFVDFVCSGTVPSDLEHYERSVKKRSANV